MPHRQRTADQDRQFLEAGRWLSEGHQRDREQGDKDDRSASDYSTMGGRIAAGVGPLPGDGDADGTTAGQHLSGMGIGLSTDGG